MENIYFERRVVGLGNLVSEAIGELISEIDRLESKMEELGGVIEKLNEELEKYKQ